MMSDEVSSREKIESPCVNICVLHPGARICVGCFRTGEEITRWSAMSPQERREITARLPERAPMLKDKTLSASARTGRGNRRRR